MIEGDPNSGKLTSEVTIRIPDRIPEDVPKHLQEVYLEGLLAGRLNHSREKYGMDYYTAKHKVKMLEGVKGLVKWRAMRELEAIQLKHDVFKQGWRTGQAERNYINEQRT